MTFDRGEAEMKKQSSEELIADLQEILSESDGSTSAASMDEKKGGGDLEKKARKKRKKKTKRLGAGRDPFRHQDDLGAGPKGKTHHKIKTGERWKCNCSQPYSCVCKKGGQTKNVKIKKDYKKSYNKLFKSAEHKQSRMMRKN